MAQYPGFFGGTLMARVFDEAISQAWLEAAKDLGIRVAAPFTVHSDEPITYEAHVMDFGGPKGTVVGVLDDKLDDCRATQGFYRSNLASSYRHYERQHFVATLNDWGWYGPEELRPVWYTGKSWS
jgi:hypothetical protein